jgi:hypothetical protein
VKNMPRVVHFEIPADDPERAIEFYRKVFGWEIEKWEGPFDYWLVNTGDESEPGINGAIMSRGIDGIVKNAIAVDSVDEYIKKIEAAGGKMSMEKSEIPGVGIIAEFKDTEGNISIILEPAGG